MKLTHIDAHCHVQFDRFDADRDAVIEKMKRDAVGGVVVGCDLESSKNAVEVAQKHENLWASVGLHPNHEGDEWFNAKEYRLLGQNTKVVAVGECGLDYYRPQRVDNELKQKQRKLFIDHCELAAELDKPLIIHSRPSKGTMDAYEDLIEILKEQKGKHSTLRGDVHFFVGTVHIMRALTQLGFTISFTAVITFAREYDSVIRATPLDRILSETDSPYVPPTSRAKGSRNDPLSVIDVVTKISEIRGENQEEVRAQLLSNAERLFSLKM